MKQAIKPILFIISAILLLLNGLTNFYINNSLVFHIIVFYFVATIIIAGCRILLKSKSKKITIYILTVVGILCTLHYYLAWYGDWKTQTIVYKNRYNTHRSIEFQMQDWGGLGYVNRTVDRLKLFPFADWIRKIDVKDIDTLNWKKVDIYANELGLKEP